MTTAMGLWISLPGWSPARASGMSARAAVSAVMSTGASRSREPLRTASSSGAPSVDQMPVVRDEEHAVAGRDAEERHEADHRGDAQGGRREEQRSDAADQRQGEVDEDDRHLPVIAEGEPEDAPDGEEDGEGEPAEAPRALVRLLELPSELDPVTGRESNLFRDGGSCPLDRAREIRSGHVRGEQRDALDVLPPHQAGSQVEGRARYGGERHDAPGGRRHRQFGQAIPVVPQALGIAHDDARRESILDQLGCLGPLKERLETLCRVLGGEAVTSERRAVWRERELRDQRLLLVRQIDEVGQRLQGGFDLPRERAQRRELGSEDLDRQVRLRARQHVVDAVADRLPERDHDTGNRRDGAPHLGEQLRFRTTRPQDDLHLRGVGALHVLVTFRPAGAAAGRDDLREVEQGLLDGEPESVGVGEGGPRGSHHPDGQRTFIERRQEAAPEPREERHGAGEEEHRKGEDRPRATQRSVERSAVAPLQEAQQPRFALVERAAAGEEQQAEGRGERQRDEHRGDQRGEIGEAERPEQQTFDAGQEEERCEDDRDDQGREEDRAAHFRRRQEDRLERRPALALGAALVLAQAPEHVLDVDDGVVDERSDGDRQTPQRHGVDRGAEGREGEDSGDQRGRQSERRDQGRAAVAEKEHQDEDDQDRPFDERLRDVADRDLDEVGLAEVLALEPDARRKRAFELGQPGVEGAGERERIRARLLLDREDDRGPRLVGRRSALRLVALGDACRRRRR